MDERYSEDLDALEASLLGEKDSVLSQLHSDGDRGGGGGRGGLRADLRRRSARDGEDAGSAGSDAELHDHHAGRAAAAADKALSRRRGPDRATKKPSARTRKYTKTHHTGIKGILADYHRAQAALEPGIEARHHHHQHGSGNNKALAAASISAGATGDKRLLVIPWGRDGPGDSSGDSDDSDDDGFFGGEGDADFVAYREERRAEMERLVRAHSTVEDASAEQLLAAVESMAEAAAAGGGNQHGGGGDARVVIVHIYDADEPVCQLVNHRLDVLSAQPDHRTRARFLRVRAQDLPSGRGGGGGGEDDGGGGGGFDRVMYPAFNVYAPGAPVRSFVAVTREVGMRPTALALEKFFVGKGVLKMPSVRGGDGK